jgi:HD-GYP domain-containing protein (c-di-GMP phosphodiesterase class II)
MRDLTSARHAASVAAYATALGKELGCGEDEIDVIRAAGLLHEIGKFTWPDRVLHAQTIADEDRAIVENHPQVGSVLVGALDGYGPVADAILYHHERMDGRGYPAGLIGSEIPLPSRILAVCSTFDTLTGGASYRPTLPREEAAAELRVAARNGQLDPELVDAFIAMLEARGPDFIETPDFEADLEFERRVQDIAEPTASGTSAPSPMRVGRDWLERLQSRV